MRKTGKFILLVTIIGITLNGYSQTKDEAGIAYNEGIQFTKSEEFDKAIASFEKAIDICNKVGMEANDLKGMIEKQIPDVYFKSATALYEQKKIDEAISKYEKTAEIANKYDNPEIEGKAKNIIPQLYYVKGASDYKQRNYEDALKNLNTSVEKDPDFAKSYYLLGVVYNKMDDAEMMKKSFDLAIQKAELDNDQKTASKAKKTASKYLANFAVKSIQKEQIDNAIVYLDQSIEYGDGDADTYYYYAITYNKKSSWDDAIKAANKALELEKDEKDAEAKIYYELGTAYYGKGDKDSACKAYKEAAYGDHVAQANYQIKEVLKCE